MPTNIANLFPTVSTPRRLSFADSESNVDRMTYSSTSLWGKHKMTYAELETAWKEYNEMEEKSAISYATSEYVDKILSERLKSSDIVLFDLNGLQKSRYHPNERRQGTDEFGYRITPNESSYAELCTSEETIRPSRLRRRSRTLEASVPPPTRSAPLSPSKFPSFHHETATIKPFPSSRPRLHLPSLSRLSMPLQRTKRLDEKEEEEKPNHIESDTQPQHIEHSDGLVEEPAVDEVLDIPERPPSRLGFFNDNDDDDD